jgi:hypothetical protein
LSFSARRSRYEKLIKLPNPDPTLPSGAVSSEMTVPTDYFQVLRRCWSAIIKWVGMMELGPPVREILSASLTLSLIPCPELCVFLSEN